MDTEESLAGLLFTVSEGDLGSAIVIQQTCTLPEVIEWVCRKIEAHRATAQ